MKQPEALRSLYELTNNITDYNTVLVNLDELRRLHKVNHELLEAMKQLDEAYCSNDYATREGRDKGRKALIAARAAIAKAGGAA